jgi:purine-binding chemotaxis protein CheW
MAITSCHTRNYVGAGSPDLQLVSFALGDKDFGVDVTDVFGIYHGLAVIPTPDAPAFMDGEVQLADRRIPVVNLRRFAGMSESHPESGRRWILMVSNPQGPVGLVVDKVSEVIRLTPQTLTPMDDDEVNPVANYVVAVANHHGRNLYLPDFSRLIYDAVQ